MFDTKQPDPDSGTATTPAPHSDHPEHPAVGEPGPPSNPGPPDPVSLERLEAQICELAGHLTAATCRFLVLLADFDARRGWASWEMNSCAQWLSWKCQMSSGTAREHVRVARALRDLPVPGLRIPPHRPAPHPVLEPRRPHLPGEPDQLV